MATWFDPLDASSRAYLVTVDDLPTANRQAVLEEHIKGVVASVDSGLFVTGGPICSDDEEERMTGSWIVVRANSIEEAKERVSSDPFARSCWDLKTMKITRARLAQYLSNSKKK